MSQGTAIPMWERSCHPSRVLGGRKSLEGRNNCLVPVAHSCCAVRCLQGELSAALLLQAQRVLDSVIDQQLRKHNGADVPQPLPVPCKQARWAELLRHCRHLLAACQQAAPLRGGRGTASWWAEGGWRVLVEPCEEGVTRLRGEGGRHSGSKGAHEGCKPTIRAYGCQGRLDLVVYDQLCDSVRDLLGQNGGQCAKHPVSALLIHKLEEPGPEAVRVAPVEHHTDASCLQRAKDC
mmetsp:Transcript_37330/g.105324  ORF Transcript_37330/g.105324 Transcript_37330/m.105324 type:complete len:235 (-) Transcript_37330:780-1484(-)